MKHARRDLVPAGTPGGWVGRGLVGALLLWGGLGMAAAPPVTAASPTAEAPDEGREPAGPTARGPELDPDAPLPPAGAPSTPELPASPPTAPPLAAPAPVAIPAAPAAEPRPEAPEAIRPEAPAPARTVTVRLIFPGAPQGVTLVDSDGARHRILPNTPVTLPLGELQILPHAGPGGARVLLTETSRILTCASADMCVVK